MARNRSTGLRQLGKVFRVLGLRVLEFEVLGFRILGFEGWGFWPGL